MEAGVLIHVELAEETFPALFAQIARPLLEPQKPVFNL